MLDVVDPDDALGDHIIERLWNYMARHDQALIKERLCSIDEMIAWADFDQDPENDQGETRQPQSDTPETTEPHEK